VLLVVTGLSLAVILVVLCVSLLRARWNATKTVAGLLHTDLNEILETVVARDLVGALFAYQSHLAAGHRLRISPLFAADLIMSTPILDGARNAIPALGPTHAREVAHLYARLLRVQRDLLAIGSDEVSPPESLAEWLAEDISTLGELEGMGALALGRLKTLAGLGFWDFCKGNHAGHA
jgi:hypothetical protein